MFWFLLFISAFSCLLHSDYLVSDAGKKASNSSKCQSARLLGIPIVSVDFVLDSIESGHLLAVEPYVVLQPLQGISTEFLHCHIMF